MIRPNMARLCRWLLPLAGLLPALALAAPPFLVAQVVSPPGIEAGSCPEPSAADDRERVELPAPAGGWRGEPVAVVATNVLHGAVRIRYDGRELCGWQWDARTLDSRFRAGVGTVLVPAAGTDAPIQVLLPATLTPWFPPLVQYGAPDALQRQDTGRFVLRVACFAVIMAMSLASLLSFVGLREPVFAVFSLSVAVMGLWLAMLSGLWGYPEPWLQLRGLELPMLFALPLAIMGGTARLLIKQGGIDRALPRLDRAAAGFMRLMLVAGLAALFLPRPLWPALSIATEVTFALICVGVSALFVQAMANGNARAAYALVTVAPFLALGAVQLLAPAWAMSWKIELLMLASAWFVMVSSLLLATRLLRLRRQRDELRVQAETDPLTGLANRRAIMRELNALVRQAQVAGTPLAVAFIDVDHFKAINDQLGHGNGDRVLVAVAGVIRDTVRRSDRVARMGGEEFLVVLPGADASQGRQLLERISARIRGVCQRLQLEGPTVTASAGLTWLGADPDGIADLLGRADAAMYVAKRAGRNRIEIAPPPGRSAESGRLPEPAAGEPVGVRHGR
jgi:diguanylate cyclase (GGDEF)-like protein